MKKKFIVFLLRNDSVFNASYGSFLSKRESCCYV